MLLFKRIIPFAFVFFLIEGGRNNFMHSLVKKTSDLVFCNSFFLPYTLPEELSDLNYKVVGQTFVTTVFLPVLQKHFERFRDHTRQPMIARFHGPIGVGKTLVADMLLKMGYFKNKYVFSSKHALLKTPIDITVYQNELNKTIENAVRSCRRSIFVFEDLTEVTSVIFSKIAPFNRDPKVDYSESLFIYISSAETGHFFHVTSKFLNAGTPRKDLNWHSFLNALKTAAGVEDNDSPEEKSLVSVIMENSIQVLSTLFRGKPKKSLWDSFVSNVYTLRNVFDVYIPFLPLDRPAVQKCIRHEMNVLGIRLSDTIKEEVLSAVGCPSTVGTLEFCPTGCKLVSSKLSIALGKHDEL